MIGTTIIAMTYIGYACPNGRNNKKIKKRENKEGNDKEQGKTQGREW